MHNESKLNACELVKPLKKLSTFCSIALKMTLTIKTHRGQQWRSEGGQGGGICPRAPPGGGRQNHAKEFFKIYILRNFEKSERIQ